MKSGSLKLFSPDSTLSIHLTAASSCGGDGKTLISKTKAGGQFTTQYFVGLEQGSVMLKIKLNFCTPLPMTFMFHQGHD